MMILYTHMMLSDALWIASRGVLIEKSQLNTGRVRSSLQKVYNDNNEKK
jgi:hypothetical protein